MTEPIVPDFLLNGPDGGESLTSCECDDCNLARRTHSILEHFTAHDVIDAYAIGHSAGERRGFDRSLAAVTDARRVVL